jgi:transcriptional regulator with XRE-family HTH domain
MAVATMTQHNKAKLTRLQAWRKREGLTLTEVAGLTGTSVPMLSLVEAGKRRLSPKARVRISRRLGVPLIELFEPEPFTDEEPATR